MLSPTVTSILEDGVIRTVFSVEEGKSDHLKLYFVNYNFLLDLFWLS